ncbi:DUF4282 domain-containing protein [Oxalicibacterium solurbis]|nr:DUF4282 domain-containing protein [Oxalicibacterium solurbis]
MDYLIAPFLIRLIYWVGFIAIIGAGCGILFNALDASVPGNARISLTIGATLLSLLLWRLLSEILVLAFNLHARLIEIRDLLSHRQDATEEEQSVPPPLFLLKKPAPPFDDRGTA